MFSAESLAQRNGSEDRLEFGLLFEHKVDVFSNADHQKEAVGPEDDKRLRALICYCFHPVVTASDKLEQRLLLDRIHDMHQQVMRMVGPAQLVLRRE